MKPGDIVQDKTDFKTVVLLVTPDYVETRPMARDLSYRYRYNSTERLEVVGAADEMPSVTVSTEIPASIGQKLYDHGRELGLDIDTLLKMLILRCVEGG